MGMNMETISHPGDMWPQRLSQQSTCMGTPLWARCHLLPWHVGPLKTDVPLSPSTWQGLHLVIGGAASLLVLYVLAQSPLLTSAAGSCRCPACTPLLHSPRGEQ